MAKFKDWLKRIKDKFLDVLFPEYSCYVCGRELEKPEHHICDNCARKMNPIEGNICRRCGMPLAEGNLYCDTCQRREYAFDKARACFHYNDASRKIVTDLKYRKKKFVVPFMATEMLLKLEDFGAMPDIIIPVPISKNRRKERGFNQAELLANEMSDITGGKLCVMSNLVEKTVDSIPQAQLTGAQRLSNLKGAFSLSRRENLKGKRILIVDDVYTTGSTVDEVAKTLRKLHPDEIYVLTFAKTIIEY